MAKNNVVKLAGRDTITDPLTGLPKATLNDCEVIATINNEHIANGLSCV
jgi:hypothetical protein